jgi:DNA repair protein RecO (recombination protein O)
MLDKTPAIVLHQLKYTDSSTIVQVYSRRFGRLAFIVKGIRNKRAGRHNVNLQPLSIIDLVIYYKEARGIQTLKEYSISSYPADIQNNIKKTCMAIFLGEVLSSVLREESPHDELFLYLNDSIVYFNECYEKFINFHIALLTGLSSFLGFEPGKQTHSDYRFFDMINGCFVQIPPVHGYYASPEISDIIARFLTTSWNDIDNIRLSGQLRNEVLETMLRYYSLHLPGLKKINSLTILKEVFS